MLWGVDALVLQLHKMIEPQQEGLSIVSLDLHGSEMGLRLCFRFAPEEWERNGISMHTFSGRLHL